MIRTNFELAGGGFVQKYHKHILRRRKKVALETKHLLLTPPR